MALAGQHLTGVPYQGSYLLGIVCLLCAGALLWFYQPAQLRVRQRVSAGRSGLQLLSTPTILLAVVSGASAFAVMSFVMTATPISMHMHEGHSMADTKWVLQSHIIAMFLPSLLTPWLFRLLGIKGLMLVGLCCYTVTIAIGMTDSSVAGFWGQLVMLGIGWNFLFVSATALLPLGYSEGEDFRAQSLNDTVVFSTQAVASLSAGWGHQHYQLAEHVAVVFDSHGDRGRAVAGAVPRRFGLRLIRPATPVKSLSRQTCHRR